MRLVNTLLNGITLCVSPMTCSRHPMDHANKRGHATSGGPASALGCKRHTVTRTRHQALATAQFLSLVADPSRGSVLR
jgi:hypothetical protein